MDYKYILLDTETVAQDESIPFGKQLVFDIGFLLLDEEFNVVGRYQKVIKEIFESEYMKNYVFDKDRLQGYYQYIEKNAFNTIYAEVQYLFNKAEKILAFNINFDKRAIDYTCSYFNKRTLIEEEKLEDIYHMACQCLKDDNNYYSFCERYNKMTEKGNYKTNAETVYCYIVDNPNFIESHTALEDCVIELEIYKWVKEEEKRRNTTFDYTPNSSSWRIVQRRGA